MTTNGVSTSAPSSEYVDEMQTVKRLPDLAIAQWHFLISNPDLTTKEELLQLKDKLKESILTKRMVPYYRQECSTLGLGITEETLKDLDAQNDTELKRLDDAITDAEQNQGESEVRDALLKKAEHLCLIGEKEKCMSAFRKTYEKTVGIGNQIDLVFQQIRVGLFYLDHALVSSNISKAKDLMELGGDWDRKNRLKAYEGLQTTSIRDFKTASTLFLDCVSTFTSYELMTYEDLVFYTVVTGMISLERSKLRENVIRGAEIQEQLYTMPDVRSYVTSLYDCDYKTFFTRLAQIETRLARDRFLSAHRVYYVRAMRVLAYKQLMCSYRSLSLGYMASEFGVTEEFVDKELHRFIAAGQLHCKVDKVKGVVELEQADSKNWQYQDVLKHGDILLNRIQKLGRVINM